MLYMHVDNHVTIIFLHYYRVIVLLNGLDLMIVLLQWHIKLKITVELKQQ